MLFYFNYNYSTLIFQIIFGSFKTYIYYIIRSITYERSKTKFEPIRFVR
jgi:hypothetical protein